MKKIVITISSLLILLLIGCSNGDDSFEDNMISAEDIDQVVAEEMIEIEKAYIQLGENRFAPGMIEPDFESSQIYILFDDSAKVLIVTIDVANQDVTPQGDIILLEQDSVGEYAHIATMSEYKTTPDGESVKTSGTAVAIDGASEDQLEFVFSVALVSAGDTSFTVEGNEALLTGTLGTRTYLQLKELIANHPEVDTIVEINVPGSVNDAVNMHTGRLLRNAGLNTKVLADSFIASGGVDLFAAGVERIYTPGATVGVHSWCCVGDKTAIELGKDHPGHKGQLAYFTEILGPELGPDFYFYTLESAPFDDIHPMSVEDIKRFDLATEIINTQ